MAASGECIMNNKPVTGNGAGAARESRAAVFFRHMWRDRQLWLLVIPPIIYIAIFHYWPMYGAQIAFRNYKPKAGVRESGGLPKPGRTGRILHWHRMRPQKSAA